MFTQFRMFIAKSTSDNIQYRAIAMSAVNKVELIINYL